MLKKNYLLLISFMISSCVTTKELTYLQGVPKQKKEIHQLNVEPYRLQINDAVQIDIKAADESLVSLFKKTNAKKEEVLPSYTVDDHGNIRLPYLNEINVLGYTTKEVRVKLEEQLKDMFLDLKDVFVVVRLAGIKYTILGEIKNPGPKVIAQNQVSIFDAISNSGDITMVGNRRKVEIYRGYLTDNVKKYTIDLTNIDAFNSEVFFIQPNDVINVPPLKQKSWGTGATGIQSITTIVSIISLITSITLLIKR